MCTINKISSVCCCNNHLYTSQTRPSKTNVMMNYITLPREPQKPEGTKGNQQVPRGTTQVPRGTTETSKYQGEPQKPKGTNKYQGEPQKPKGTSTVAFRNSGNGPTTEVLVNSHGNFCYKVHCSIPVSVSHTKEALSPSQIPFFSCAHFRSKHRLQV